MAIIKDLYPPIIEGYLPAFSYASSDNGQYIKIYFDISNYNSIDQITAVQIAVFDSEKNISIVKDTSNIIYLPINADELKKDIDKDLYYIEFQRNLLDDDNYQPDRLYKVQLRFTGLGASYSSESEKVRYQNTYSTIKNNYDTEISPYINTLANYNGTEGENNAGSASDVKGQFELASAITGFGLDANDKFTFFDISDSEDPAPSKYTCLKQHIYNNYLFAPLTNDDIVKDDVLLLFLLGPYNYTKILDDNTGEVIGITPVSFANWKTRFSVVPNNPPFGTLTGSDDDPVCIPAHFYNGTSMNNNFHFYYLEENLVDPEVHGEYQVKTYQLTLSSDGFFSVVNEDYLSPSVYTDVNGYIYNANKEKTELTNRDYILNTLAFLYDKDKNNNEYIHSLSNKFASNFSIINLACLKREVESQYYTFQEHFYNYLFLLMFQVADPSGSINVDTYLNTLKTAYDEEFDDSQLTDEQKEMYYVGSNLNLYYGGSTFYHYDSTTNTVSCSPDFLRKAEAYLREKIAEKDDQFQNLKAVEAIESRYQVLLADIESKLKVLLSENPNDIKTSYLAWVRAQNQKIAREICKYHNIYTLYFGGVELPTGTSAKDSYVYDYNGNIICGFKDYVNADGSIDDEGSGSLEEFTIKNIKIPATIQADKSQVLEGSSLDKSLVFVQEGDNQSYDVSLVAKMGNFTDVPDSFENLLLDLGSTDLQNQTEQNYLEDQYTECYIACYDDDLDGNTFIAVEPNGDKTPLINLDNPIVIIIGEDEYTIYKPYDENVFSKLYTFLSDDDKKVLRYISVDVYNKIFVDLDDENDNIYQAYWRLKTRLTGFKNVGTSKMLGDNDYTASWYFTDYDSKENVYIPKTFLTIINNYYEKYVRAYSYIYKKCYKGKSLPNDTRAQALYDNYFKNVFPHTDQGAADFLNEAHQQISLFLDGKKFDIQNELSLNFTKKVITTVKTTLTTYTYKNGKWVKKITKNEKADTVITKDAGPESGSSLSNTITNYYIKTYDKNGLRSDWTTDKEFNDGKKNFKKDKAYKEVIETNIYTLITNDNDLYYLPDSGIPADPPYTTNNYKDLFSQLLERESEIDENELKYIQTNFQKYIYNTSDSSMIGQMNTQLFLQSVENSSLSYDTTNNKYKNGGVIGKLLTKMKAALGKSVKCEHDIKIAHYILKATNTSKKNSEGTGNYTIDNLREGKWFIPSSKLSKICDDTELKDKAQDLDSNHPLKYCPLDNQFNLNSNTPDNSYKISKTYTEKLYLGDAPSTNRNVTLDDIGINLNSYPTNKTYKNYVDARSKTLNDPAKKENGKVKAGTGGYYARLNTQANIITDLKNKKQTAMAKNTSLYSKYNAALSDYSNKLAEKETELNNVRAAYRDDYVSDTYDVNYLNRLDEIIALKTAFEAYYSSLQGEATQLGSTTLEASISIEILNGTNDLLSKSVYYSNEIAKLNGKYSSKLVKKKNGLYISMQTGTTVTSVSAAESADAADKIRILNTKYLNQLIALYQLMKDSFNITDVIDTTNIDEYMTQLDAIFDNSNNFGLKQESPSSDWYSYYVDYFSEWSTVCLIKPITPPKISISNLEISLDSFKNTTRVFSSSIPAFVGTYEQIPSSESSGKKEELSSYTFTLYDVNDLNTPLDIYTEYVQNSDTSNIQYICNYNFELDKEYVIAYSIYTENGYTDEVSYNFKITDSSSQTLPFSIYCCADNEEARVVFVIISEQSTANNYNRYKIQRSDEVEQYKIWHDILNYQYTYTQAGEIFYLYDYSIESDKVYQYRIVGDNDLYFNVTKIISRNDSLLYNKDHSHIFNSEEQNSNNEINNYISVSFDYVYLLTDNKQLNIKFNNTIQSFKYNISESKQEPLDSEFPFITKNGKLKYRSFPINALISLEENENQTFINKNTYENAIFDDWAKQRIYREAVYDYLYNHKYFLFKSATEGNIIIKLMDINFSPNQTLGRLIYSFSANVYECYKFTPENIIDLNIQSLESYSEIGHIYSDIYSESNSDSYNLEDASFTTSLKNIVPKVYKMENTDDMYYDYSETEKRKIEKIIQPLEFTVTVTGTDIKLPKYIDVSTNETKQKVIINNNSFSISLENFNIDDEITFENIYPDFISGDDISIAYSNITFGYNYSNCDGFNNEKIPFLVTEIKENFSGYIIDNNKENYLRNKYTHKYTSYLNGINTIPKDITITDIDTRNYWTIAKISVLLEYYSN